ncbi:MAG: S49 family peptidase [Terriglobales bacterium]
MIYELALSEIYERQWAILPERLETMTQALLHAGVNGTQALQVGRAGPRSPLSAGGVAVIPITGVISHRETLFSQIFGGTSTERFAVAFRQALSDPNVGAIVFDVDSPGGSVDGVEELSAEVYRARGRKKTVAVANAMAASAGYWVASACDEIIVTPSGSVGSIGVFAAHEDISKALEQEGVKLTLISAGKYKTEGTPFEPLSNEARASIQATVDVFGHMFVNAVARNRGVGSYAVKNGFGEGRMVLAQDAVKLGMADGVGTLDQTLARLLGRTGKGLSAAAQSLRRRELELLM